MITIGSRVRMTAEWLRSVGYYTGPEAPTNTGPFARGVLESTEPCGGMTLARVKWDNGHLSPCNVLNLEVCR